MVLTFAKFGYDGALVSVEVDVRNGIPAVDIVGLADGGVREFRERMKAALGASGFAIDRRVLISLSPADLRKEGANFDLPACLAVAQALQGKKQNIPVFSYGEVELSGKLRPVSGAYNALVKAREAGYRYAVMPKMIEKAPDGMRVFYADTLLEAYTAYLTITGSEEIPEKEQEKMTVTFSGETTLDETKGHGRAKFAMAVAAAGRHNILAWGALGCGKTMLLQRLPDLTPDLLPEEKESTRRIYSIAGMPRDVCKQRPFRMPHQTASLEGIYGGGRNCFPGEISFAHNGTLFLDDAAEFRSNVLQMLRVPIEAHTITISRAGRTTVYPADFQLAITTNPCPCGNFGIKDKVCLCSRRAIEQYWCKFSAPLLDRVEIRISVEADDTERALTDLREMIKTAWETQLKRQGKLNARLSPHEILAYCKLPEAAQEKLDEWTREEDLSQRAVSNLLKVSRTIADMSGHENILLDDLITAGALHGKLPVENLL